MIKSNVYTVDDDFVIFKVVDTKSRRVRNFVVYGDRELNNIYVIDIKDNEGELSSLVLFKDTALTDTSYISTFSEFCGVLLKCDDSFYKEHKLRANNQRNYLTCSELMLTLAVETKVLSRYLECNDKMKEHSKRRK